MEPPCKKYLWRNGGVFTQALSRLLRIAKHDKIKLSKRVPALPVNVAMPPDNKKQCNGVPPPSARVPAMPKEVTVAPVAPTPAPTMQPSARTPPAPQVMAPSPQVMAPSPAPARQVPAPTPAKRTPNDFVFGKTIGEGSFSTVYLSKDIHTSREYAIKVCEKRHLIRERKTEHVKREKKVLNMLSDAAVPFFVKLYCTFQDSERLYFVLSYAKHSELLPYINKVGSLNIACTKFYAAEMVVALEHLRRLNIIHRDLKPENILLDEKMHILLTDFGSAKIVHSASSADESDEESAMRERKNSFVGTAQYISPELLTDKSASFSSDLWALGCIVYQMVAGLPPFRSRSEYIIFQKILKLEYDFPEGFCPIAKDFVHKLLVLDPAERLGMSDPEGYPSLRSHPFFEGIDWDTLSETTPPPIYPYLPGTTGFNEIRGQYCIPDHLEPGLDDKQLTRLLGLDLAAQPSRKKSVILDLSKLTQEELVKKVAQQSTENKWHSLVQGNLILKQGLVEKRKGLFARRRMLVLTTGPHLYYADPVNMVLKGEIPFSRDTRPEPKNFKIFFVHTPNRSYYLEDPEGFAMNWCKAIEAVYEHTYGPRDNSNGLPS